MLSRAVPTELAKKGASGTYSDLVLGVLTVGAVAAVALWIGGRLPVLGSAVTGMILGLALRNLLGVGSRMKRVTGFCSKWLLKTAIVLLGATFTFQEAATIGWSYFPVILSTIVLTLVAAYLAGHFLGVPRTLASLIGAGTAICGATAILTVAPVVKAKEEEVTYAVSTIFIFNLAAMLIYPLIAHVVGMSEASFGAWAGSAIHDTSSVLAAAFGYGESAGAVATVVKLTRTLFLVPLLACFALLAVRQRTAEQPGARKPYWKVVPTFIVGFLLMTMLSSTGLIPTQVSTISETIGRLLITVVLVAVGLSSQLSDLRSLGFRPLLIGFVTSIAVASVSVLLLTWL